MGVKFELFLDRRSVQSAGIAGVAVATAGTNVQAAAVHLYLERVATAFGRFSGNVPQQIEFVLFAGEALQAPTEIVGVENGKASRAFRQRRENLLVGRSGLGKLRHDGPRLVERVIRVVVVIGRKAAAVAAAAGAPARRASGGSTRAPSASAGSAGTTRTPATSGPGPSAGAAGASGATSSACPASGTTSRAA